MISDVYFPRINGVSTSIATFRDILRAMGHRVLLIAPEYDVDSGTEEDILRVPARVVPLDPEDRLMSRARIRELIPQLQSFGPDLIHIHTPFMAHYAGVGLARRLGVPVIESYHTFFEEYLFHYIPFLPATLLRFLARSLTRSQSRAVDALIVPGSRMSQVLCDYGVGTVQEIIPTGVDPALFSVGDGRRFRQQRGIPAQAPILVYVGRIAHEKNIWFLLDVLARVRGQVPAVQMLIAGEGPALAPLQRRVRDMGLEAAIHFVGYLDRHRELADCYAAGDLMVFASRTETQGLVVLEAMAAGTPVVSTAVMGTADVLVEGEGARIAVEEVGDFAAKVVSLLSDDEARASLAARGRQYVRHWTPESMTERLLACYQRRISPGPATDLS